MNHDGFEAGSTRVRAHDPIPTLPLELGGGLSLSLAANLYPTIATMILGLGGLLPLIATSVSIAFHRGAESLVRLSGTPRTAETAGVSAPHFAAIGSSTRAPTPLRQGWNTPNSHLPRDHRRFRPK